MGRSWKWHSTDEMADKLARAESIMSTGVSMNEAAAAIGVSRATFARWRRGFRGMSEAQIEYVRSLESEVARLRRVIKEIDETPAHAMR